MCVFVLTNENTHARQTSSELGLLSLNRVFHGIRFTCDQLHRVADLPLFVSLAVSCSALALTSD